MLIVLQHCFNLATHVLMRELKARKAHGDEAGTAYVDQELDILLKALTVCKHYSAQLTLAHSSLLGFRQGAPFS